MADHAHPDDHAHGDHAHGGVGKYIAVFLALCALTAVSVFVGSNQYLRIHAPAAMWAMMMAVSCAKASLVILFFMHILWEANWKYVLTVPASMMSIFLVLMLVPDIGRRTLNYSAERWYHAAQPSSVPADAVENAADPEHAAHGDAGHKHAAPGKTKASEKH
jgi:cytochrome c oxidase subunit 4